MCAVITLSSEEWGFFKAAQVGMDYSAYSISWPLASDLNNYCLFILSFGITAQLLKLWAKVIKDFADKYLHSLPGRMGHNDMYI